jgi:hypothetical protein
VPIRRWLIPSWWKKTTKDVPSTFNARAETVAGKPMFRSAFKRNRCIIPASGYFEWKTMPDCEQPCFISAADGGVLSIAVLWNRWHSTDTGETVLSSTMIVTDANAFTLAWSPARRRIPYGRRSSRTGKSFRASPLFKPASSAISFHRRCIYWLEGRAHEKVDERFNVCCDCVVRCGSRME